MSNPIKKLKHFQVLDLLAKFPVASPWYNRLDKEARERFGDPVEVKLPKRPLPKVEYTVRNPAKPDLLKDVLVPKVPKLDIEPKPGCPEPVVMMRPNPVPNWDKLSEDVKNAIVDKLLEQRIFIDYETGRQVL